MSEKWDAFLERANRELFPKLDRSGMGVVILNGPPDAKQAVEVGALILLEKPIIIVKVAGYNVPPVLARIAEGILEIDAAEDLRKPATVERMHDLYRQILRDRRRT